SSPVNLVQGQRYYIEALHKEGVGSDHMAVGWQLPDGTQERPIAGSRLSPFAQSMAMTMASTSTETASEISTAMMTEQAESGLRIFPNPAQSGTAELRITGYGNVGGKYSNTVEIH